MCRSDIFVLPTYISSFSFSKKQFLESIFSVCVNRQVRWGGYVLWAGCLNSMYIELNCPYFVWGCRFMCLVMCS